MVSLIDDMEGRGWIVRKRSETDRRHYQLSVCDEGSRVLDILFEDLRTTEAVGLQAVVAAERATVLAALDTVYTAYVRPNAG
jgi:DNA-binding MarR family transcriptional regulator